MLYIFSGLPGSGKTTLAQRIAQHFCAVYLRIDTVEHALQNLFTADIQTEGYAVSNKIAADNLELGLNVVADCCNPVELSRRAWELVALEAHAAYVHIQVICSDVAEHRRRVEARTTTISGLNLPNLAWSEVQNREHEKWTATSITIDTANRLVEDCVAALVAELSQP